MSNQTSGSGHRHHHHHRHHAGRPDTPGIFSGVSRKTFYLSCLFGILLLTLMYLAWRG
ncbi:MAG: hypothetical protein PHI85_10450 [Victivallaceae bacterium]|nr:hypothetical protein [Victivallaceae bacterium]